MHAFYCSLIVVAALTVASCDSDVEPAYSMHNDGLFEESPHVVVRSNSDVARYALRWKYGFMGFYFRPEAKIVDGNLCFSLQGTTSSGSLSGEKAELAITDLNEIEALKRGGACWLEPSGERIKLEVKAP